ncbi:hypothetical protein [Intrasporangium flavum]|uniref:hypothetical protein n=1 Tax=Intrasporangium flavum TaxID=1428657 RepID=UPI00096FC89C|nr:hypothetical protein [Intrasporangium flavum]
MTQTAPPTARPSLDDTQVLAADRTSELPVTKPEDGSPRSRLLDLSLTQILGGSLAAATAAALGSRLGLLGTIAGAAIGSVVTAVAANLYTNSMARAREAMVLARAYNRGTVASRRPEWWRLPDRAGARRLIATTGALFAVAAAFLTGVQLTTGAQVTGTTIGRSAAAAPVVEALGSDASGTSGSSGSDASRQATTSPTPTSTTTGTPAPAATTDAPASGGAAGSTSTGAPTGTSTSDASATGTTTAPTGGTDPQSPSTGTLPANPAQPTP